MIDDEVASSRVFAGLRGFKLLIGFRAKTFPPELSRHRVGISRQPIFGGKKDGGNTDTARTSRRFRDLLIHHFHSSRALLVLVDHDLTVAAH